MPLLRRDRTESLPADVRLRAGLGRRDRVLAAARDDAGTWVIVGTGRLYAVPTVGEVLSRPWHLVDAGNWDQDNFTLTVTWVDGARPNQWVFTESMQVLAAFRERVQASVVIAEAVPVRGRRTARVVIRKDLEDGSIHDQTLLGPGVRLSDPGVDEAISAARARLREQVGLD